MEISESGAVSKSAGIKVLGVGAAAISAIRPLAHKESADVEYIAVGPEDLATVAGLIGDTEVIVLATVSGDRDGISAATAIASQASLNGLPVAAFVIIPVSADEAQAREAAEAYQELKKHVGAIFAFASAPETSFLPVNNGFCEAVESFATMMQRSNLVGIDPDLLRGAPDPTIDDIIAVGWGNGENMCTDAVNQAYSSLAAKIGPGREHQMLINITTGLETSIHDVGKVTSMIVEKTSPNASASYSHTVAESMTDSLRLTVVLLHGQKAIDDKALSRGISSLFDTDKENSQADNSK